MKYLALIMAPMVVLSACSMVDEDYGHPSYNHHYHGYSSGGNQYHGHVQSESGAIVTTPQGTTHGHPDASNEIVVPSQSVRSGYVHGHGR